ncbi:nitrate/sulfonate/bicarbonate ABC transporter ATP-binding protein [Streptomyces sp. CBMA123]|uniref:ABC transporter ATP-binding protein n=1 Tax=Streptomyces sp. CBMA123 TaxID=1896313 RepID=UPI0016619A75|nr:nitrate/sulfonate/bicarbonate ABC transporter ATP-binding protein [Streptomyces sp. CBMA123]MBD0690041.1 nitrate ABC transporter ATP-binding protein [Streptomyces sp. CBMA123]
MRFPFFRPAPAVAPPTAADGEVLLETAGLTKSYAGADGELPVLSGIDLTVRAGEIVALLGRSGSGKSTLLRCLAGLLPPSSGTVRYRGTPLTGANPGSALVFQTFALLPWLTVRQNVELGLEARGVPPRERARSADQAIDLIGLAGFENAYPKELSGGMRQRVGFARALVVEPDVLMMDEPFSALDVLTAENLRGELMELWDSGQFPTRAVVLVTHNIEEAVLMADRVVVLGSRPYGTIRETVDVTLERPRDRDCAEFDELVDRVYRIMTGRPKDTRAAVRPDADRTDPDHADPDHADPDRADPDRAERRTLANTPLPTTSVDGLSGLAEMIAHRDGRCDLADLADQLGLDIDDLLPQVDALDLLGFAEIHGDDLLLTEDGTAFARADVQDSRALFAGAALDAPLVRLIVNSLGGEAGATVRAGFLRDLLAHHYTSEQVDRQLETATDWGRYAGLFGYDAARQEYRADEA